MKCRKSQKKVAKFNIDCWITTTTWLNDSVSFNFIHFSVFSSSFWRLLRSAACCCGGKSVRLFLSLYARQIWLMHLRLVCLSAAPLFVPPAPSFSGVILACLLGRRCVENECKETVFSTQLCQFIGHTHSHRGAHYERIFSARVRLLLSFSTWGVRAWKADWLQDRLS